MITKNKVSGFVALGLICTTPLFAQQADHTSVSLSQKDAESAVKQFEAEYVDAYNRKDLRAVAALFTENGVELGVFGAVTQGREQIEKTLAIAFALPAKWKTEDTPKDVVAVASDVIVAQGTSVRTPADGSQPSQTIFYTKVLVRQANQWRLAAVQYATPPSRYVGKGSPPKTQ